METRPELTAASLHDRRDRAIALGLCAASVLVGATYAWLGPGYVLDDWFTLGNAKVDGIAATPGHAIFVNRPGAGLLYCLQFGLLGGHPLAGLAVLTALGAATAVLLFLLARRYLPRIVAAAIAGAWIVLPNHTSLEFWQSCAPLGAAVVLVLAAGIVIARPDPDTRQWTWAIALFSAGILTYEAVLPVAILVAISAPALAARRPVSRRTLRATGALLPASLYVVVFRNTQKTVSHVAPLDQVVPGHFGWGIAPAGAGATVVMVIAASVLALSLARLALPGFRGGTGLGERLILAGALVIVTGTIPFAFYLYAPLGAGDRFDLVSSIGGAIAWVGIGLVLWRWRTVVVAGGLALLVMAINARVQRENTWTTAAADGKRIVAAIAVRYPNPPDEPIVLGPTPVQRTNISAFVDQSNVTGMLRYLYGTDVRGGIAYSQTAFNRYPAPQQFDIHALSRLEPDVDLTREDAPTSP